MTDADETRQQAIQAMVSALQSSKSAESMSGGFAEPVYLSQPVVDKALALLHREMDEEQRDCRIRQALDEIYGLLGKAVDLLELAEPCEEVDKVHAICDVAIPTVIAELTLDVGPWPFKGGDTDAGS